MYVYGSVFIIEIYEKRFAEKEIYFFRKCLTLKILPVIITFELRKKEFEFDLRVLNFSILYLPI